jgi:heparin/heparan-sulfate lyase
MHRTPHPTRNSAEPDALRPWRPTIVLALLLVSSAAALQDPAARVEVSTRHPRVFVRHDDAKLGLGLNVSELRLRAGSPAYARWRRAASTRGPAGIVERAARYLEGRSPADLDTVRGFLLTRTFSYAKDDVSGFLAGAEMAMAFDWIYDGLSGVERTQAMSNIVATADSSADFLLHGQPDINHNYTYMALSTVAIVGLVLRGEAEPFDQRAREYLAMAALWLERPGKVLDTWKARQGAWSEGSHYTFHETLRTLIMTLHAYRTATGKDYFPRIKVEYGNFVARSGRFLVASVRPDLTFERIGDITPSRVYAAITVPLTLEMISCGVEDAAEAARLRSFARELEDAYGEKALSPEFDWGMRVFHDPDAPLTPSYRTLPLSMRMGAGTSEQIMFRNGWGPDSTLITILAGDHYTDHQHFDKGHFLIYRRGGLLVDSGVYDTLYKPHSHWTEYACRSLAHNTLLVFDPRQVFAEGYGNEGGQNVLRGLQHHGDWQTYLAHYKEERLDTAQVLGYAFDERNHYGYLHCDLTRAYSDKVSACDRQFVYLPANDFLVVYDRITSARPEFVKRSLLHFQESPSIDGDTPKPGISSFRGARVTRVRRSGELVLGCSAVKYAGELVVHTLLPFRHDVIAVGGKGFEYYNSFQGINYAPSLPDRERQVREAGGWRIEIAPTVPACEDQFLTALQILDGGVGSVADARLVTDRKKKMFGVHYAAAPLDQIICFSARQKEGPVSLPLRYDVSSTSAARHLHVDLPPSREIVVEVNGRVHYRGTVSDQGILSFEDGATGRRTVVVK